MLVAAIILDPGIEAGVGNRFDEPPGSFLDALNSLGKLFQKLVGSYELRPPNDAVAVVTGESFRHPEQARVILARVVKGTQALRPDTLDVPDMEVFVSHQAQKFPIAFLGFKTPPRDLEGRRVEMFESAATLG